MGNKAIILSISMLVSGRDEMFKSLESLSAFREAFPCEVILVDTGCSEEQRSRAEKYADKIVDFTWCDDFAAARNAGLKEAAGEWFLYLDDDEWFDNPREIVTFFQTGEYRKYNSASYVVRNYRDYEGNSYEASYPLRMAKMEPGLKFEGQIHEYLYPIKHPRKVFSDFVHHYGYVFTSDEARERHANRNIAPLLEICKKQPGDPRWIGQLAQEYFGLEKYDEVIQTCENGLKEWKRCKDSIGYMPAHVGLLYSYIMLCMEIEGRYKEEESWLTEALENELTQLPVMQPTVAFYCLRGIMLCHKLENDSFCAKFLKQYLSYAKKFKDDVAAMESGTAAIVGTVFDKPNFYGGILTALPAVVRMENCELAEESFFTLAWEEDKGLQGQEQWEKDFVDALCSVGYRPLLVKMLQTLIARAEGMREMYAVFLDVQAVYKQSGDTEKLLRLYRLVSELKCEHAYILEAQIIMAENRQDSSSVSERKQEIIKLFTVLFERFGAAILKVQTETWDVAMRMDISLEPLFLQMNYRVWRQALCRWGDTASIEELKEWETRISLWQTCEDIRYTFFQVKLQEAMLEHYKELNIPSDVLEEHLWKYADTVINFNRPYIQEKLFLNADEILFEDVQLALKLKEIQADKNRRDTKGILVKMKDCISLYPPMEGVISEFAKAVRDAVQKEIQKQSCEQTELYNLVTALKKTAFQYIENGEKDAAMDILLQIQACMPEDQEVKTLIGDIK